MKQIKPSSLSLAIAISVGLLTLSLWWLSGTVGLNQILLTKAVLVLVLVVQIITFLAISPHFKLFRIKSSGELDEDSQATLEKSRERAELGSSVLQESSALITELGVKASLNTNLATHAVNTCESICEGSVQMLADARGLVDSEQQVSRTVETGLVELNKLQDILQRMYSGMEELKLQVDKATVIGQGMNALVDVVRKVANHADLLAVNAAIEASRAGDSGRRVVHLADDVRKLATTTQESIDKISVTVGQVLKTNQAALSELQKMFDQADYVSERASGSAGAIREALEKISSLEQLAEGMVAVLEKQQDSNQELKSVSGRVVDIQWDESVASDLSKWSKEFSSSAEDLKVLMGELKNAP